MEGIIREVTTSMSLDLKTAFSLINAILEIVKDELASGHGVMISGFGEFRIKHKRARTGRNPQTRIEYEISKRTVVTFHPSKVFRRELNTASFGDESGTVSGADGELQKERKAFSRKLKKTFINDKSEMGFAADRECENGSISSKNKVVLFDIDSKIPNLALMKLSQYYKQQGYPVELSRDIEYIDGNKHFASTIFHNDKSVESVEQLRNIYGSHIEIGGSGYSLKKNLQAEIDGCFPDYSIYGRWDFAVGFLTRGCAKKCSFCLVPQKEGRLNSAYASFDDFVPESQGRVVLLDNNLLAAEHSNEILEEIVRRDYQVNFSQTLDISYLNETNLSLLLQVKSMNSRFTKRMMYFSCNTLKQSRIFIEKKSLIEKFGKEGVTVITMFGYNTKLSEDYEILSVVKRLKMLSFVQEFIPFPSICSKVPEEYFDMDLDDVASFRFRTNGQNGEKFLRYVNKLYFAKYNKYYLPILKAIYRYNNKSGINKFLRNPYQITENQEFVLN